VHQQEEVMVEVLPTTAPFEQDTAAEGVTQIRETRAGACAATFYACYQTAESEFYAFRREGRTSQRNEKGFGVRNASLALAVVTEQLLERAGMQGQKPNLMQLAVANGNDPRLQVHVGHAQTHCFAEAHTGAGHQPDQSEISVGSQAAAWGQSAGGAQQLGQLVRGIDMRHPADKRSA